MTDHTRANREAIMAYEAATGRCGECGFRKMPERAPMEGYLAFGVSEQCVCTPEKPNPVPSIDERLAEFERLLNRALRMERRATRAFDRKGTLADIEAHTAAANADEALDALTGWVRSLLEQKP